MKKIAFLKNKKVMKIILIICICLIAVAAIVISIIVKTVGKDNTAIKKTTAKETKKVLVTTTIKKEKKTEKVAEATTTLAQTTANQTTTQKETTNNQPETTLQTETTTISPETTANTINTSSSDSELLVEAKKYVGDYRAYLNEVLEYTNQVRAEQGKAPLVLDEKLSEAAMARALENSKKNIISHVRPNGTEWHSILISAALTYGAAAENIAAGQNSATAVVEAWKGSPGHYANMISDSYKKLGVGLVIDPSNSFGYTWVQLFTD